MLKGKKYEHQRHKNQLRPRYTENVIKEQEVPIEVLYNVFDISASPIPKFERRTRKRKKKSVEPFSLDPKRKRYKLISEGNLAQGRCCGGKPVSPVVLKYVIPIYIYIYIVNKLRSVDQIPTDTVYRIQPDFSSVFDLLPPRKLLLIFFFNEKHVITLCYTNISI